MTARALDGRAVARQIYDEIEEAVRERVSRGGTRPRLATVLVGEDPASAKYVELKQRNARNVGIDSEDHRLPAQTTTEELLALTQRLSGDDSVSAILIQQPTPKQVEPCTPAGIMELLRRSGIAIEGMNAVVVGRSNLVGKPTALLLLKGNATVTLCHTRTRDLGSHTRTADILVAAAGRVGLITKDMVKPGAAVVDVSTNWEGGRQVGDLGKGVEEVAGWLTPNPGGVGPMTRAMLIKNTYEAEVRRRDGLSN